MRSRAKEGQAHRRAGTKRFSSSSQFLSLTGSPIRDEMPVGEGGGQGAGDIFVMRWDGSDVRQITDDAFKEATPAFAPSVGRYSNRNVTYMSRASR
jgi:hypothetical protein